MDDAHGKRRFYNEIKHSGAFVDGGKLLRSDVQWLLDKGYIKFEFQHQFAIDAGLSGWKVYSITDEGRAWVGKKVPLYINREMRLKRDAQSIMNELMVLG